MNKLILLSLFFLSFIIVQIRAPDIDPILPDVTTTEATVSTTTSKENQTETEFVCPLNCTCTEQELVQLTPHCYQPCSYFHNYWNKCHPGQISHLRYYRNVQPDKYRMCNNGFSHVNGKCVKHEGEMVISCEFPQRELPCCHIEFPKKCHKSQWGENCFISTYYYCGEMCDRKDNLSEADFNKIVRNQERQQRWKSTGKSL